MTYPDGLDFKVIEEDGKIFLDSLTTALKVSAFIRGQYHRGQNDKINEIRSAL